MSDVPDEVLQEILSRVTVTPLLRFRCVCKSWKSLIDSDQFIKHHLNQSRKSNSNLNFIIRSGYLYSADLDDLLTVVTEINPGTFQELSHPLKSPGVYTEILGSCDGLLVLSNGEEENVLWNPSTRRFHNIPVNKVEFPPENARSMQFIVYGFGYDFMSDDYKLVRILHHAVKNDECDVEAKVYSLKSNSWKRIHNFPFFLKLSMRNAEHLNGALHWLVSRLVESDSKGYDCFDRYEDLVAAFDLGTEDYRLVSLPDFSGLDFDMNLGVLGGCLILICDHYKDFADIWVMKEYGVEESWLRLFTLTESDGICYKSVEFLMPIAYSNCGRQVLLRSDSYLTWHYLDQESIDLPMVQIPYEGFVFFHTCLKSLVLLNGRYM